LVAFLSHRSNVTHQRFLRHADRDSESVLAFNSGWTDFLIYDSIGMHIHLARGVTHANRIFLLWVSAKYPSIVRFDGDVREGIAELLRIPPRLGGSTAQKRTFLAALKRTPGRIGGDDTGVER